jgi:HD-like signal output (HDOD) protein
MTQSAPSLPRSSEAAFAFVQSLATELSSGKIDLPSFPAVAIRIRKVLADDNVGSEIIVRVVGSEPALSGRVLQIANSAALNISGKQVTDLRTAIARVGFNMIRSASISFAMSQLKKAEGLRGVAKELDALWQRTILVAAIAYVVARRYTTINADTAMLTGMMHTLGRLYILTRSVKHPLLFADQSAYQEIVSNWHANVAKALLENWEMADEIVQAVHEYEDLERVHHGEPDLTDVLTVADLLAAYHKFPDALELNMQGVNACTRMQVTAEGWIKLIEETQEEIAALQSALGE